MRNKVTLLSLFIFSNLLWICVVLYLYAHYSVAYTYQDITIQKTKGMLAQSLIIANKNLIGKSVSEVKSEIVNDVYGKKPFIKGGCLYASFLCLKIGSNSTIISVNSK